MSDNKGKELTPEQLAKIAGGVSCSSSSTSSQFTRPRWTSSSSTWRRFTSSSSALPKH